MTMDSNEENWSHVRETVLMLNVAVSRIEHAMVEGNDSFTSLSQSFVDIAHSAKQMSDDVQQLDDSPAHEKINQNCMVISGKVENSIIAFQFYDRLSQRMALVSKTLNSLTEILKHPDKKDIRDEWTALQNTIRSKYTLDADQEMFDSVLNGTSIEDALKAAVKIIEQQEGDVEFF